ncbi:MAG: NBR1-Ig-like domain-containing protein [Anaerolineales bacterium]|nr:NBR1-Ig-like domain-containing protein [Anaerolineales bacterium]
MKREVFVFWLKLWLGTWIVAGLVACNMPRGTATPQAGDSALHTAAAQTVAAQVLQGTPSKPTPLVPPTIFPFPTAIPTLTSPPPTPTVTLPLPTSTPLPCDRVRFIKDVTIPDNTEIEAGSTFVKTWRLQNAGACTWSPQYALVLTGGEPMGSPVAVPLPQYVASGEMVDVSVTLTAPQVGGTYRAEYKLRNASNIVFGIGEKNDPFYVQIKVPTVKGVVFDFLAKANQAEWKSGTGNVFETNLNFNGADDDVNGVAKLKEGVRLENGTNSSRILLTVPKRVENGFIAGTFPAYLVQSGDRFRARIGFMTPDGSCASGKAKFRLNAVIDGNLNTIETWEKVCNGQLLTVDVNLSRLQGKTVQFMLAVLADGDPTGDWAIWSSPRIERP